MYLSDKFSPAYLQTSGKMTAILGAIFRQPWTQPEIQRFVCTPDGHVMAQRKGEVGYNEYFSNAEDFVHNLRAVAECVGLNKLEFQQFRMLVGQAFENSPGTRQLGAEL